MELVYEGGSRGRQSALGVSAALPGGFHHAPSTRYTCTGPPPPPPPPPLSTSVASPQPRPVSGARVCTQRGGGRPARCLSCQPVCLQALQPPRQLDATTTTAAAQALRPAQEAGGTLGVYAQVCTHGPAR